MELRIGCNMPTMTKKQIAERSKTAFEKAMSGKFSSRPITPEQRKRYLERIERMRAQDRSAARQHA